MAMIKCPECGQEISDKAKKCIHCGNVFVEEKPKTKICPECGKENPIDAEECTQCGCPFEGNEKNIPGKIKKYSIPILAFIIVAIIAFFAINFLGGRLNEDEKLAYQNAKQMKDMMKDPDSFKLYDEMFLIKRYDDEGNIDYTYTVFKYGGTNGYGALTTDEAIFKDDDFVMNYADEPDEDDSNYGEQLLVKLDLELFLITSGDDDKWERVDIDIDKIKKKMDLK